MTCVVDDILRELTELATRISQAELEEIADRLSDAHKRGARVFLAGAGRSGCVVRGFANRMLHLGFACHLIGDVTTPPIREGDILFVLSGSGKTASLVTMATKAKSCGAVILTITLQKEGTIGQMADGCIVLPGTTRLQNEARYASIQPVGSSFEQLSWLTCDGLVMLLMERLHLSKEDLLSRHANLE